MEDVETAARFQNRSRTRERPVQKFPELAVLHVVVLNGQAVAAGECHIVRRVNEVEVSLFLRHQFCHILFFRAVTAQEDMIAQPVAGSPDAVSRLRNFRHGIRLRLAFRYAPVIAAVQQTVKFVRLKTEKREVVVGVLQFLDFQG